VLSALLLLTGADVILRSTCEDHLRHVPGCRPCGDAGERYRRSILDVLPDAPLRTDADDVYVAVLVAELKASVAGAEPVKRVILLADW
jgi:hypothetical protein